MEFFVALALDSTERTLRAKDQEGPRSDKRITSLGRIEQSSAQEDHSRFASQLLRQRFGRVRGNNSLEQRSHRIKSFPAGQPDAAPILPGSPAPDSTDHAGKDPR